MRDACLNMLSIFRLFSKYLVFVLISAFLVSCDSNKNVESEDTSSIEPHADTTPILNTLTEQEKAEGWMLLFNGETLEGWRGLGREKLPEAHWIVEDGAIKKVADKDVPLQEDGQPLEGCDLMTLQTFENFELTLEWRISPGGNSGVKYNVSEELSTSYPPDNAALGFEYQILDDERHLDALLGKDRTSAALYDIIAPENKTLKPVGEFNSARIVFRGYHGEHWLNGVKVLEYDLNTPEMKKLIQGSKFRKIQDFAQKRKGHIVLQDHADAVWFRNIKIRILNPDSSITSGEKGTKKP
jgi:hypothetical protein